MLQGNPYLHFNGNCQQAMTFYKECLGGELSLQTVGESPMADQMPAELKDRVLHSVLTRDGFVLMASDVMEPGEMVRGNTISLSVSGGSKAEIEPIFAKLTEGGNINHPLKEEFFGTYGDLIDRFGIAWMFQAEGNAQ